MLYHNGSRGSASHGAVNGNCFAEYYASFYTQMIITPGTYTVEGDFFGFHLIGSCNGVNRFAAGWGQFDVDFQGSTLILTVPPPPPLLLICTMLSPTFHHARQSLRSQGCPVSRDAPHCQPQQRSDLYSR